MASREGIEPSTRRLRVTGGPSGGVRPCRFPLMLLGLASASVRSVRFDSTGWGFTLGFNFYSRRWPRRIRASPFAEAQLRSSEPRAPRQSVQALSELMSGTR